jgi:hypothetical protein
METPMLEGGCQCGAVRYRADGRPYNRSICHCSICRRTTGAPMVAWFSVAKADFVLVRGRLTSYRSSAIGRRGFCPACGTQITFQDDRLPDEIDITIASLDEPEAVPPEYHIFTSTKLDWVKLGDGLPLYEEQRG